MGFDCFSCFSNGSPLVCLLCYLYKNKMQAGEVFDASFEISLNHDGAYEVVLGDLSDYQKLELIRPSLVNSLTMGKPTVASGL